MRNGRVSVLILDSGTDEDKPLVGQVLASLRSLEKDNEIHVVRSRTESWPGRPQQRSLREQLEAAQVVVVLVSVDIDLALLREARRQAEADGVELLAVRLRPLNLYTERQLTGLTVLPTDRVDVSTSRHRDQPIVRISDWVGEAARRLNSSFEVPKTRKPAWVIALCWVAVVGTWALALGRSWLHQREDDSGDARRHLDLVIIGDAGGLCDEVRAPHSPGPVAECVELARRWSSLAPVVSDRVAVATLHATRPSSSIDISDDFANRFTLPREALVVEWSGASRPYWVRVLRALVDLDRVGPGGKALGNVLGTTGEALDYRSFVLGVHLQLFARSPETGRHSGLPPASVKAIEGIVSECFEDPPPTWGWACLRALTLIDGGGTCSFSGVPMAVESMLEAGPGAYPRLHELVEFTWLDCECAKDPEIALQRADILLDLAHRHDECGALVFAPIAECLSSAAPHDEELAALAGPVRHPDETIRDVGKRCEPWRLARVFNHAGRVRLIRALRADDEGTCDIELGHAAALFHAAHRVHMRGTRVGEIEPIYVLNWAEATLTRGSPLGDLSAILADLSEDAEHGLELRISAAMFLWVATKGKTLAAEQVFRLYEGLEPGATVRDWSGSPRPSAAGDMTPRDEEALNVARLCCSPLGVHASCPCSVFAQPKSDETSARLKCLLGLEPRCRPAHSSQSPTSK